MKGVKNFFRILMPAMLLLFALLLFSSGCSSVGPGETVEQFYNFWGEQDYEAMYKLLNSTSRENNPEEYFLKRYSNISQTIGLQSIRLEKTEKGESSANRATFSLSVVLETTTVGMIPVHYVVELSRENKRAPWRLQWDHNLIFPELDKDSEVELSYEKPRRGVLLDRNGAVLAGSRVFKELGAVPGAYEDEEALISAIASLLGLSAESIAGKLHQPWVSEGLYVPLAVLTPAQENLVDQLLRIPGVMISEVEKRYYPTGPAAAHLTGYLGEITAEELVDKEKKGYSEGDLLGKTGLEAALEQRLAGVKGCTLRILGADGNETALVAMRKAEDGDDITLTIDQQLQKGAAEALGDKKGAVVALDPRSGAILALCSSPAFDPNHFIAGLTETEWQELIGDQGQPFLNRALSGIYPPGSAFKPFTAAAAIDAQALDPAKKIVIKGERWQPSKSWGEYFIRRVNPEVKQLDLNKAMRFSDNIYFAQAGIALGKDKFMEYGRRFGFDEQIPFLLPVASSRLALEGIQSEVQLADSSFGQGKVMSTPLQLALLYSVFAGGEGSIFQPYLVLSDKPAIWKKKVVDPSVAETVHRALVGVLHGSDTPTAAGAISGFKAGGKTGTAEIGDGKNNICWYVTYGPAEKAEIVVVAVIEGGTWAATDALPVGRAVLEQYLLSRED